MTFIYFYSFRRITSRLKHQNETHANFGIYLFSSSKRVNRENTKPNKIPEHPRPNSKSSNDELTGMKFERENKSSFINQPVALTSDRK